MLSDTNVNVVMTPSDEKVPSMDELTTITAEEFRQILADIGL